MENEVRLINANDILKICDKAEKKFGRTRYLSWERLRYLVSLVPTVNAVEVPNCEKCFWHGRIEGCWKCEHCIGNTSGTNNFLRISEVTGDGE